MKKILFAALIAVSVASSAFAKDEKKISSVVLNSFMAEFDEATDVNWIIKSNFNQACFNLDGKQLSVFYNLDGDKIGTSQSVSFATLPSKVKKCIAKKYNDYVIKETILFEGDQETAYYISAENNAQAVILKAAYGHVSVFKKTDKGQ